MTRNDRNFIFLAIAAVTCFGLAVYSYFTGFFDSRWRGPGYVRFLLYGLAFLVASIVVSRRNASRPDD
jgi:hypothetical protein